MAKKLKLTDRGKPSVKDILSEILAGHGSRMKNEYSREGIFADLREQLNRRHARYMHDLEILRDKMVQDAETIRMALDRLASEDENAENIPDEKVARLKRTLNQELPEAVYDGDLVENIRAYEKYLGKLEKEVMEILTKRFKK
ncbi:MAG: hypothetical protein GF404_12240 [candidate division Zixibacteria bacterium]|jgi:hypothetical protein|nr:hypothetical protein [candidate division Zixibacteria bacterium]